MRGLFRGVAAIAAATMVAAVGAGPTLADVITATPPACDIPAVMNGRIGSVVCPDRTSWRFVADVKAPFTPTSSAWWTRTTYDDGEVYGAGGHLIVDGKGRAAWVQSVDDSPYSARPLKGGLAGLRLVVHAADTGDPDNPSTSSALVYGVTTTGDLVQMPVTWTKRGMPVVGKQ